MRSEISPLALAHQLRPQLVQWRRDIHSYPELAFREFRTASTIASYLARIGYEVRIGSEVMDSEAILDLDIEAVNRDHACALSRGIDPVLMARMAGGLTAVIGDLRIADGPTVAFRVDMDALPILESTEANHLPASQGFSSERPGQMHACGHDGHVAIGLGLATVLAEMRSNLRGNIRLIFQPAEEGVPGGAAAIVAKGMVDDVDVLLCFHLGLDVPSGHIATSARFLATSKYRVAFSGVGAHVTNSPQTGRNALLAAAASALAIHAIPPHSQGWFSTNVGVLHAGEAQGICPRSAMMELGLWCETPQVHTYLEERLAEILTGTATAWGVALDTKLIGRSPTADQDPHLATLLREAASQIPSISLVSDSLPCRAGEDAFVFLERLDELGRSGNYVIIGSDLTDGHHTPGFNFDETSLEDGVAFLAQTAASILTND